MSDTINRADAIDAINTLNNGLLYTHMDYVDAVRSVPSAEVGTEMSSPNLDKVSQGLRQDLVKRQDAIDAVCEYCEYFNNEKILERIKSLPSAEPTLDNVLSYQLGLKSAERTGHWIHGGINIYGYPYYFCSECGYCSVMPGWNYCPNCGARMVSEDE